MEVVRNHKAGDGQAYIPSFPPNDGAANGVASPTIQKKAAMPESGLYPEKNIEKSIKNETGKAIAALQSTHAEEFPSLTGPSTPVEEEDAELLALLAENANIDSQDAADSHTVSILDVKENTVSNVLQTSQKVEGTALSVLSGANVTNKDTAKIKSSISNTKLNQNILSPKLNA